MQRNIVKKKSNFKKLKKKKIVIAIIKKSIKLPTLVIYEEFLFSNGA